MTFVIRANHATYVVSDHTALRMLERFITEEMIIEALENGDIIEQPHGRTLYEHQIFDSALEEMIVLRVVVEDDTMTIVSVIDDTID